VLFGTQANVARAGVAAHFGRASGFASDPWFFTNTGTDPSPLSITFTLSDIDLIATADPGEFSAAEFGADIAFGRGDTPGENILTQASFFRAVTANETFALLSFTLLDKTFMLDPGQTFWLTASLESGAVGIVPEPPIWLLLCTGLAVVISVGSRKRFRNAMK
jgi:hypothetical protein